MRPGFIGPLAPLSVEEAAAVEPPLRRKDLGRWLRTPHHSCADPRFEIRRLVPHEFDRVFDLVDEAFGTKRPREVFDWMYRRNPLGPARCWILEEREGGAAAACGASWPWPLAHGVEALDGWIEGDAAAAPRFRGQRVRQLLRASMIGHPSRLAFGLAWAGEGTVRAVREEAHTFRLLDPLPRMVLRLDRAVLPAVRHGALRFEEVSRFDAAFDPLTHRSMGWRGLWSAHTAEFLNWRYFDHPVREYRAFAVGDGSRVQGYCVIGLEERRATLMELVAPSAPAATGLALLRTAISAAREAGVARVNFFATPSWPHWALLRGLGFQPKASSPQLMARERSPRPECFDLASWRLGPGDHDTR